MLKRKLYHNGKVYTVSVIDIMKKAFLNHYTPLNGNETIEWKLDRKKSIIPVKDFVRTFVYIILLGVGVFVLQYTPWFEAKISLLIVVANLLVIGLPIFIFEWIMLYFVPIEIRELTSDHDNVVSS